MKKAILTIGLFSLIMILTSFTTPEVVSTDNNANTELVGSGSAGNKRLDLVGSGSAGNKRLDLVGSGSAGNKRLD